MTASKEQVRAHWEADPCGAKLVDLEPGTPEFFAQVERTRYELEPFIEDFADFRRWRDRRVLEVGVGLGSDSVRFVRAGAVATGVDLTEASVALVKRRLELEQAVADVRVADAESLPFASKSFDLVYSWGVLHHTPDTAKAVAEIKRVLRPGGEARIMLYSRRSCVSFGLWARYGLASGRPWRSFEDVIANHMESPGTKAYTTRELVDLFAGFQTMHLKHFVTPYDRHVAGPAARLFGGRFGWFAGIVATTR